MKAVYEQGLKDGRKEIFDRLDVDLKATKKSVKYLPPGRPKK